MKIKSKNIRYIIKDILPKSSIVALKSMFNSFIVASICSIISYVLFKNGNQPYHDIVVGNITIPGIYKNIDFYIYYTFIVVYIIMFFFFNRRHNRKTELIDDTQMKIHKVHLIIGLLPAFLMLLLKINTVPIFNLCFCLYLITVIYCLKQYKMKNENIIKLVTSCFYVYLSSAGILALTDYFLPNIADIGTKYFIPSLWILLVIAGLIIYLIVKGRFKECEDVIVDVISAITQLIIPFCLFSLINTRYYFQGSQYAPVQYSRFIKIVIALIVLLFILNVITIIITFIKKRRINSVWLSTLISFVSVCFWDTGYNLLINTDQFHTGETAVVYQQIVEMGQKWGSEFVSVLQGLGFSLSWLNEIVFGGTFSTYTQTQNLLLVMTALLTVILVYPIIEHKWLIILIAPIMPLFYMNRIYLIAPVFLFLLNPKIIRSPIKWSYCYILTCIIHVWYQPTYGGAVAASLIPVLILIWYKAYKNTFLYNLHSKKNSIKICTFLFSVVVIGILCIPMLLDAIYFLRTNGYETMIGNGVSVSQTIKYTPNYLTGYTLIDMVIQFIFKFGSGLAAFIIMLYMFTRYVVKQKDDIKMIQGVILTVSASIAYFLMLPAIFTRIDPGISRIGGTGFIFFGFLVLILIYLYRKDIVIKPIAVFICGLSLCAGFYVTYPSYLQIHQKANSIVYIPDNAIYAKPEETGLENLGYAFVQDEQYLHEAMVINEMCHYLLNDNQTYYDFTDKSIYYLFADKKIPGLYASPLVVANEKLQTEVIETLKNNDVPLILVNQPLRYIGVSESLRSYRVYRYFMEQNYNFVSYKGCNFLVRNDIDLTPIQDNIDIPVTSNMIGIYDNLIDESIYNTTILEEITDENISAINNIKVTDENMYITGSDPFLVFDSKGQIDFSSIQVVEINLKNQPVTDMAGQLFVKTENIDHNETNTIHFDIKTSRIIIPLYNFEQFSLDTKLVNLRLDFDNVLDSTDIAVESIKLYSLNNKQKISFAQQFAEIVGNVSDNRLDDIFHQPNLMYLPREWGESLQFMENRFSVSEVVVSEQEQVQVTNNSVSVHLGLENIISGTEGEFLLLTLDYGDFINRNAILMVKGIDKNGNDLKEEFQFIAVSGKVLIPIASSPNCLQAQELTGFDLTFLPDKNPYKIKIEETQIYRLTN